MFARLGASIYVLIAQLLKCSGLGSWFILCTCVPRRRRADHDLAMSCACVARVRLTANRAQHRVAVAAGKKAGRGPRAVQANASCALLGVGSSVPETVISNKDLSEFVETNDEWISSRTGIRNRHVLAEGESLVEHAVTSSEKALQMSGVSPEDVDMIIMATSSHEDLFGSASQVSDMKLV